MSAPAASLSHRQLLELKGIDTPTVVNALELCSTRDVLLGYNRQEVHDFMPEMGPMVGYAVTAEYCASRKRPPQAPAMFEKLLRAVEDGPKPAILVVRDVDSPGDIVGAGWGECTANFLKALGAVGLIVDGAIRDHTATIEAGFHALARRFAPSHGMGQFLSVGEPVEVFGTTVATGELIHADKHGFVTIPAECAARVADAARAVERCEREFIIAPAREGGFTADKLLQASKDFNQAIAALKL